jgi:hypothetical protein
MSTMPRPGEGGASDDGTPADGDAAMAASPRADLPPDPVAYDSERNAHARARGLAAPYIAGGRDPDPDAGRREERFYGRLLLIMIAVIVASGFVLGIIANVIGALGAR